MKTLKLSKEQIYKKFIDSLGSVDDIIKLAQVLCNRINSCYKKRDIGIYYASWASYVAPKEEKHVVLVVTISKEPRFNYHHIRLFKKDIKMLLRFSKKQLINWVIYRCKLS